MGVAPADSQTVESLLKALRDDSARNAWPIQDLSRWPDRCRLHLSGDPASDQTAFLLVSGHPGTGDVPVVILGGDPDAAGSLLADHLPEPPLVVRETAATFLPGLKERMPDAKFYSEQRMDVSREEFRPAVRSTARQLSRDDAAKLAAFIGAPPQAARGFEEWVSNAVVYGIEQEGRFASIASTMVRLPEVWTLVSIETASDLRGRGFGTQVCSAITAKALEEAPRVSLTVRKDNDSAIRLYRKLGFQAREDRIWVSWGTDAAP